MLFNSGEFLIFFPIVVVTYYLLKDKYAKLFLLAASWFFYASWKPEYIFLIIFSTVVDFYAAKFISKAKHKRKLILLISLISNLGLLFIFKYFNLLFETISILSANHELVYSNLALPIGISFYTFQTLSYTIDVYRRRISAENNFFDFALYVSFFPQLVAGPIERPANLLPQLKKRHSISADNIRIGLQLMLLGYFQKVVVADNLARFVDVIFDQPNNYSSVELIMGTIFFGFQIYTDFAGYTNIARGAAKILGIDLVLNFKQPYLSESLVEFWKRWHISLSSWFKDYVYISLGGNRVSGLRWIVNIFITFILSGLWHGANYTFIVWGFLHAVFYLFDKYIGEILPYNKSFIVFFRRLYAITVVFLLWIFFRSPSLSVAWEFLSDLFSFTLPLQFNFDHKSIFLDFVFIIFIIILDVVDEKKDLIKYLNKQPSFIRYSVYYFTLLSIILLGDWGGSQFVYFSF